VLDAARVVYQALGRHQQVGRLALAADRRPEVGGAVGQGGCGAEAVDGKLGPGCAGEAEEAVAGETVLRAPCSKC
jgi:hypothetical protein